MRETRRRASASGTVIALLCAAGSATAGTRLETLRFVDSNPPPSPVVGFRLYVGAVGKPVTPINLGMPPPGTDGIRSFPLLVASGASVQLRLTAYDAIGRESDPSNRILRAPRGPTFDHDADGASDLVRIDSASGLVEILSAGSSGVSAQALSLGAPPQSSIVARGDFDGSGTSDLLWQRHGSRDLTLWLLGAAAGSSLAGGVDPVALPKPGPGLRLLGSGDLDGDARDDLVFRDVASGDLDLWFLDGATLRQEELIPGPSKPWRLVGIADLAGDVARQRCCGEIERHGAPRARPEGERAHRSSGGRDQQEIRVAVAVEIVPRGGSYLWVRHCDDGGRAEAVSK